MLLMLSCLCKTNGPPRSQAEINTMSEARATPVIPVGEWGSLIGAPRMASPGHLLVGCGAMPPSFLDSQSIAPGSRLSVRPQGWAGGDQKCEYIDQRPCLIFKLPLSP